MQALTGILAAKYERGITLNGIELQREESRRLELQADCFGGAYLGADQESFPVDGEWLELLGRGRREHGLDPEARPRRRRRITRSGALQRLRRGRTRRL